MAAIVILFFCPFLIPLVFLSLMSIRIEISIFEMKIANFLFGKGWIFWVLQAVFGFLFGNLLAGQIGMLLTLLIPSAVFFISYYPLFLKKNGTLQSLVVEGVLCFVSTCVFWSKSVGPHNWRESGLAFVFIFPAFFVTCLIATGILALKRTSDVSKANHGNSNYKFIIILAIILLILKLASIALF